ncbi:LuxR C-terminal-related transcriptional regulator [Clostridium drakei]|uniref:Helix-turn-helix transcriptional regulator n=1 Tax=Clostridium drakei TaxID=332101 RepID=A0A2U8DQB7_9CLOT|nr:LuxR C-terminal-related transcriptional regulator [Clostridium drakei]AWI04414.1 helix-turn-helix transcriptional regulator [Clostridium drakei]
MKQTKLLKRKRINKILSEIFNYSLTIVEAPMGFGKTTAVKNFLSNLKTPYLWIAFLNSTASSTFFWEKFSNEIMKVDESSAKKLKKLGFPIDAPQVEKIIYILNNINYKEKTVLVIDDYHLSKELKLYKFIEQIILNDIDNFYIVLITRDTTNINFSELFSKGKCYVISQQQLKFNEDELKKYCLMMYSNISDSALNKIIEYTDGWISLTYMMLLALKNGIPVGMNSTVDELVESTLFNPYDNQVKNFLLKLSVMDDFTAKQASFVTEEEKAAVILKKLNKKNSFVFYDEQTHKYKIHNVLLDFLRTKQNFKEEELHNLYRKLGKWYLKEKEFITAYDYFNRAGDTEFILSQFNNPENISNDLTEFKGSFEMFENTSEELLVKYPIAYLQHIFNSILKGNDEIIENSLRKLDRLQKLYENMENIDLNYKNRIIAETLIIKKFTKFNHLELMKTYSNKALELLNGKKSYIMLRQNEVTFGSPHLLYIYFRDEGTFKEILKLAKNRMIIHSKVSNGCGTGSEFLLEAEYAMETGNFPAAELNSLKAIYKAKTKSQVSIIICAYFNLTRLYILQGKIKEGIENLNSLNKYIETADSHIYNTTLDLCKGYIYACLKQKDKIPYWLQTGDMSTANFFYQGMAFNYIVYGKAVMLSGNYINLEMLSESFVEHFSVFSNQLGFIHNGIFKAVARYNIYSIEEGLSSLKKVILSAQADGIIMPFIESASYIMDMLNIIQNNDSNNEFVKKIIIYGNQYNESLNRNKFDKITLSPREIEVLALVAEGLKREEVASHLTMSQETVRTHLRNIYQKLGVSGKISAIKIARISGLI